eukprot:scaffold39274_cov24-Prasinocladus_malaysianus.AAC.1
MRQFRRAASSGTEHSTGKARGRPDGLFIRDERAGSVTVVVFFEYRTSTDSSGFVPPEDGVGPGVGPPPALSSKPTD